MDRSTHKTRLAGWKTVVEQCNSDHRVFPSNSGLQKTTSTRKRTITGCGVFARKCILRCCRKQKFLL